MGYSHAFHLQHRHVRNKNGVPACFSLTERTCEGQKWGTCMLLIERPGMRGTKKRPPHALSVNRIQREEIRGPHMLFLERGTFAS